MKTIDPPIVEPQQYPDAQATDTGRTGPFDRVQTVIIVSLLPQKVDLAVHFPIIRFPVDSDAFGTGPAQAGLVRLTGG